MARTLTVQDAHEIVNMLVIEAFGGAIDVVDTSSFVSAGEMLLASGVENTLNTLALVLGRTFMAVRPYEAKLRILNTLNSGIYANRMRKISFYSRYAQPTGASNTDISHNLEMGFTNGYNGGASTASMWEQNQPIPLEMNFGGSSEWQDCTTVYEKQLQVAFRSENEFIDFVSGIMTERGNDIESQKEAFNRLALINFMGGVMYLDSIENTHSVINMTSYFNYVMGTNYTTSELLSTHLKEFLGVFVALVKTVSDELEYRSIKYHWSPAKTINGVTYSLLRHTPKSRQKMLMYKPFWNQAEAMVLPEIFNDRYLNIDNFEGVQFWQSIDDGPAIQVLPAIPGVVDGEQTAPEDPIIAEFVLGMIFDEDAIMVDYQMDDVSVTPKEARKHYHNIWWTFRKNAINDFTENAVIFIMDDSDVTPEPEPEPGS